METLTGCVGTNSAVFGTVGSGGFQPVSSEPAEEGVETAVEGLSSVHDKEVLILINNLSDRNRICSGRRRGGLPTSFFVSFSHGPGQDRFICRSSTGVVFLMFSESCCNVHRVTHHDACCSVLALDSNEHNLDQQLPFYHYDD